MDQHREIEIDLQLIGKYLAGEASPQEACILDEWRETKLENDREFQRVARLWEQSGPSDSYQDSQTNLAWQGVRTILQADLKKISRPMGWRYYRPWMVAATLLLLVGVTVLGYRFLSRSTTRSYRKVVNSGESIVKDTLADLSIITLAPKSHLYVASRFGMKERDVKLDGQAYFSIQPLPGKPFVIQTGGIEIIVLGTAFNVINDSSAVTVGVTNGTVKMQKDASGILVKGGSTGVYNKANKGFILYPDSLNHNASSYATGMLYFYDMPLSKVKLILERTYHTRIVFSNPRLAEYRINTKFENQPLSYVLDVIAASLGIHYRIAGKTVYLFGDVYQ